MTVEAELPSARYQALTMASRPLCLLGAYASQGKSRGPFGLMGGVSLGRRQSIVKLFVFLLVVRK